MSTSMTFTLSLHDALPICVLTLIYTFEGGIAAVIWTDLIQLVIYIGGSLLAAYELLHLVPGGWSSIAAQAATRSEEHTSELQSLRHLVCRLLLEKKTSIPV